MTSLTILLYILVDLKAIKSIVSMDLSQVDKRGSILTSRFIVTTILQLPFLSKKSAAIVYTCDLKIYKSMSPIYGL
jgi:hypothetical protein